MNSLYMNRARADGDREVSAGRAPERPVWRLPLTPAQSLARPRSLSPPRAFACGEFLSSLPKQLKSPLRREGDANAGHAHWPVRCYAAHKMLKYGAFWCTVDEGLLRSLSHLAMRRRAFHPGRDDRE